MPNSEYELRMIHQSCEKWGVEKPKLSVIDLKLTLKHLTGYSSLEGASDQQIWQVNKSELVWNARLSAYLLLSVLNPEAKVLKQVKDLSQL